MKMRLFLGADRKARKATMSNSVKQKTSGKRKLVTPVGKAVGGYKKARKHQNRHLGSKKRSRKVMESETGKTHNDDRVNGSEVDADVDDEDYVFSNDDEDYVFSNDDEDYVFSNDWSLESEYESETERRKKVLEKWAPNTITISFEEHEFPRDIPEGLTAEDLCSLTPPHPDGANGYRERMVNQILDTFCRGKNLLPTNEKLDELLGYKVKTSWSEEEINKLWGIN